MATSKVDMSLDDIIAQNKRGGRGGGGRGRGGRGNVGRGGRGRGRGVGRGSGVGRGISFRGRDQSVGRGTSFRSNTPRGGLRRGGRQLRRGGTIRGRGRVMQRRGGVNNRGASLNVQSLRQRQQHAVQAQRQTARNASIDAKRNFQVMNVPRGQRGRRGMTGRGRRPLVRPTTMSTGRGRSVSRGRGLIRGTRTAIRRGRGGRTTLQRVAAASVARARRRLQTQPTISRQSTRGRGRGRRSLRPMLSRIEQEIQPSNDDNNPMQVSVISPTLQYDPIGVELSPNFGSTHHTSQSLNSRFTPAGNRSNAQRIILPNGRSVEYQN